MQRITGCNAISAACGASTRSARCRAGTTVVKLIEDHGRSACGSTFLEVGTGRRIGMPLTYWLLGADKVVTVDLNPYLKEELVRDDIAYIRNSRDAMRNCWPAAFTMIDSSSFSTSRIVDGDWTTCWRRATSPTWRPPTRQLYRSTLIRWTFIPPTSSLNTFRRLP